MLGTPTRGRTGRRKSPSTRLNLNREVLPMRSGARAFVSVGFPGAIGAGIFVLVTGIKLPLIFIGLGLYLLLHFCNQLDDRSIRDDSNS